MKTTKPDLDKLTKKLLEIRNYVLEKEKSYGGLDSVHPDHLVSAQNLIQYMAFRTLDVREIQIMLTEWGLSSLSKIEKRVQASLDSVLEVGHLLMNNEWTPDREPPVDFVGSRNLLDHNTESVIGPVPEGRRARIMVTLPTEAATEYELVEDLLKHGMNCARINCAHDSKEVWSRIIDNVRKASNTLGKPCKIFMDIAGPKLRTGRIPPSPMVIKVRPVRSATGVVQNAAEIILYNKDRPEVIPEDLPAVPVDGHWLQECEPGNVIRFKDARKSNRRMIVVDKNEHYIKVEATKTIYFIPGLKLTFSNKKEQKFVTEIGDPLPNVEGFIQVFIDDELIIKRANVDASPGYTDENGIKHPAEIGCSLPPFLDHVKVGEAIWLDDGKIGGRITQTDKEKIVIRITQAKSNGSRLKSEKGINLPESDIKIGSLTEKDLKDLDFVVAHADIIGHSFVNQVKDVEDMITAISNVKGIKGEDLSDFPGIVVKIETQKGFNNLADIILAGMRVPDLGVMIARGDLAIECGFGRLAELQEEILWICEAAHIPAIWATQVLEGMAKAGLPTRAEVTDAAMGQRAECIMLNKGEFIVNATKSLDDILRRMQDHQTKKRTLMRKLNMAINFFEKADIRQ
ncbi:MAG: pyruvate kinase [Saprospiraceae bacterium]|nr:pyruvate kinase [Saprospiraceae bacterium]